MDKEQNQCKTCKYFDFSDLDTEFCELHNQICENIKDCKDYSEIIGIHSRDKQTRFKSRCLNQGKQI